MLNPPAQPASEAAARQRLSLTSPWMAGAAANLVVVFVLGVYLRLNPSLALDAEIMERISQWHAGWLDLPLRYASALTGAKASVLVIALFVGVAAIIGGRTRAAALFLAIFITGVADYFFGEMAARVADVRRPAPGHDGFCYPSGHLVFFIVMASFVFLGGLRIGLSKGWLIALGLALFALSLFVGFSRLYILDHWFTDIIGAYFLGASGILIAIPLYLRLEQFNWQERPRFRLGTG